MKWFLLRLPVVLCVVSFFVFENQLFAQVSGLVSGPMIGDVQHQEAKIWMEVQKGIQSLTVVLTNQKGNSLEFEQKGPFQNTYNPVTISCKDLSPETTYEMKLKVNGKEVKLPAPVKFTTLRMWGMWAKKEIPPKEITIMTGSCLYVNEKGFDRDDSDPYGQGTDIFKAMAKVPSDLMLWLGDNIYLREPDFTSETGISHRYSHTRADRNLQEFLMTRPHYAIWDDHDFGPNDGNTSYPLKHLTLNAFKTWWANPSYGTDGCPGTFTRFMIEDADFFLLDDRYFRYGDNYPDSLNGKLNAAKTMLGPCQLEWLKNGLLNASGNFKFICLGSQVLNQLNAYECYRNYPAELNELIGFIRTAKISGVVFLSGDRHFSEVLKYNEGTGYPLYEITSSALTSKTYKPSGKETDNPAVVPGSILTENNFTTITLSGTKNDRFATIRFFDVQGKERFSFTIQADELKVKRGKQK